MKSPNDFYILIEKFFFYFIIDLKGDKKMKLKELRKKEKKNQKEIANYLNVALSTYNGYELGTITPTIETLKKLSKYYNVTLDYICDNENNNLIDASNLNEYKKGIIFVLKQLNEKNDLILLGYATRLLSEQMKSN